MNSPSIRDEFVKKLDSLTDEQVAALLQMVEAFENSDYFTPTEYDESKDPTIAMFSGPTDLGERSEEILNEEFGIRKSSNDN
jgi:hypothetical protein